MARVLVVEDDEIDRLILSTILTADGHEVGVAHDGNEALQLYRSMQIDVVVTDIVMAGPDGVELTLALGALDRDVAIVAVSGKGPMGLRFAALAGAVECLSKPIDQAELLNAVAAALGRRKGVLDSDAPGST